MKILITDGLAMVEEGPAADPNLPEEERQEIAFLLAMRWAIGRINQCFDTIDAVNEVRAVTTDEANRLIARVMK